MRKQHKLSQLFNARAGAKINKGHVLGAFMGVALACAYEFSSPLNDYLNSETHIYNADNLITATLPQSSADLVVSVAPDSDIFVFSGFAGLEQDELNSIVSEHYQRIERVAEIAADNHYYTPKYEDVIKGFDVRDVVKQLDPEKSYSHADIKTLIETSSDKMLKKLDYRSAYIPHKRAKRLQDQDNNISYAFGIHLIAHPQGVIVDFVEDGPARAAGFKQGDIISHANDVNITNIAPIMRPSYIRDLGRAGDTVTFQGTAYADKVHYKRKIQAGKVETTPVRAQLIDGSSLYVKLTTFSYNSEDALENAITTAQDKYGDKIDNIIIDLRDNGGGFVHSVNEMLDDLTDGDQLGHIHTRISSGNWFSSTLGYIYGQDHYEDGISSSAGQITDLPLRVIIDNGSASASEIFAGNLQDVGRAKIIGKTPSFGKATMQRPFSIGSGDDLSKVRITMGAVMLPQSGSYQGVGIQPDILVAARENESFEHLWFESKNENILRAGNDTTAKDSPYICTPTTEGAGGLVQIWVEATDIYSGYTKSINLSHDRETLCAIDSFKDTPTHSTIKENGTIPSV